LHESDELVIGGLISYFRNVVDGRQIHKMENSVFISDAFLFGVMVDINEPLFLHVQTVDHLLERALPRVTLQGVQVLKLGNHLVMLLLQLLL
jgi:hypothetical protein